MSRVFARRQHHVVRARDQQFGQLHARAIATPDGALARGQRPKVVRLLIALFVVVGLFVAIGSATIVIDRFGWW